MAGLAAGGEVAVTHDGAGVSAALVEQLKQRGYLAYAIADESALTESTRMVIALNGLRDGAAPEQQEMARSGFRLARAFAGRAATGSGVFVSVQDCGGDFGLRGSSRAIVGSLAGLIKTAAQEWPSISLKAIDMERAGRTAAVLAAAIDNELFAGGPQIEVGLRANGVRTSLESRFEPLVMPAGAAPPPLPEGAVVVCSGGARGVTAATMIALAKAQRLRFALLGRTPLSDEPPACRGIEGDANLKRVLLQAARARGEAITPAALGRSVERVLAQREIHATLAAIEQAGSEARYLAVDVTDEVPLSGVLANVRQRWGAIGAVIHGAGVVADKLIQDKTDDQFERVWTTKVAGLSALLSATRVDPLRALVMFASVAARSGNVGQCDYAMANEALNKLAAYEAKQRGSACIVKSLNWGPWEAGMVTPSLKAYFEEHNVPLIDLTRGGEMLVQELSVPSIDPSVAEPRIEIVLGAAPQQASIAGADQPARALDVLVRRRDQPYLVDHAVDGTVVLPLVMVIEWFCRAAEAFVPGMRAVACDELRVLRGVRLSQFDTAGDWLRIVAQEQEQESSSDAERSISLVLMSPQDVRIRHYSATIRLCAEVAEGPAQAGDVPAFPLRQLPTYGGALFHGPAFQVIGDDARIGQDGATATMAGLKAMDWPDESWCNDPALLDGGLQLAVLWSEQRLGGNALPAAVASYRRYAVGPISGPVRCVQRGKVDGDSKAVSEIAFLDAAGRVVAELAGVETYRRP